MDVGVTKTIAKKRVISPIAHSFSALASYYDGDWHSRLMRATLVALDNVRSNDTRELLVRLAAQLQVSDECAQRLTRAVAIPPRLSADEVAQSIADQLPCESIEARFLHDEIVLTAELRGAPEDAEAILDAGIDRGLASARRAAIDDL